MIIKSHITLFQLIIFTLIATTNPTKGQQTPPQRKAPVGIPKDAQWFNGKWYRVYNENISWPTALGKCKSLGGQLAVVPDEATWAYLKSLAPSVQLWLGASDEKNGIWKWVDGTPVTFTAWRKGEPNNSGGVEHYMAIFMNEWNDMRKDGEFPPNPKFHIVGYICEWKDR